MTLEEVGQVVGRTKEGVRKLLYSDKGELPIILRRCLYRPSPKKTYIMKAPFMEWYTAHIEAQMKANARAS